VSVTIGGQPALSPGAAALPGYLGQYLVVAQVPAAAAGGVRTVSLKMGDAISNSVQIPVR
jgi:uncharacterized protein (TIGR03437 family)